MKWVLLFGTFDPLHEGHRDAFRQARQLGDHLTVVVARDVALGRAKDRLAHQPERQRLAAVAAAEGVDKALLGDTDPAGYQLLADLTFDVLAVGYDQEPADDDIRRLLNDRGKSTVEIFRLKPYRPDAFKSSYFR